MIQDKCNENNEKYSKKCREYNYYRSYVSGINSKYMGFSNMHRNSSNKNFNDSRRNNNYDYRYCNNNAYNNVHDSYYSLHGSSYNSSYNCSYNDVYCNAYNNPYNNNFKAPPRRKRFRSFNSTSNSNRKGNKFFKKFKNYNDDENIIGVYKNGRKRSYSSMRVINDKEQRNDKVYIESRYSNNEHKRNYLKNFNIYKKRNYYSYKKNIYNSDRRNYDTHYGQGNIFYNNEYYLINDGTTLKRKKIRYGNKNISRSNSKSYNSYIDRMNNRRNDLSRNGRYKETDMHHKTTGSVGSSYNGASASTAVRICKYKDKDDKSNKSYKLKNSDTTNDDDSRKFDPRDKMGSRRNSIVRKNDNEKGALLLNSRNYIKGTRKRRNVASSYSGTRSRRRSRRRSGHRSRRRRRRKDSIRKYGETDTSDSSQRGSNCPSYVNKKKKYADKHSGSYKNISPGESTDDTSVRKKYNHKRNRTEFSEKEDSNSIKKKKKKKKENYDSDDEIVHFSWKRGMILNNCYLVIRKMGEGTFGRVLLCEHTDTKKYYAVKVVRNIRKYTKSAKIEADILKKIQNDDYKNNNIVKYHGKFMYYDHMCLVFEPLGPSLYEIITKNNYNGFHLQDIKLYCIEMLKALNYLRKISLTHTDLKPENILLDDPYFEKTLVSVRRATDGKRVQIYRTKSTGIKLIDFGCATFKDGYHGSIINTRQYRAPEVILNIGWDVSSDMWSFGCVLAELYTGDLLFRTHEHLEHLALMEAIIQPIPKKLIYDATKTNGAKYISKDELRLAWPENASSFESIKYVKRSLPLHKLIRNDLFCDFLYSILQIDPSRRPTPSELLKHKFLQEDYGYY
ncbi:serine/threonine kinase-1 [Plasmodium gonderi]|uniref:Serine/threonine kinase-1 n=1 Tax=Plasmodium gonderi TaxID=77519 RepID=A0A1Y1JP54_PLAGO|nr:serine/threonine kinase-1 [Plasmodium gonderi]GAW82632.1 serine/threonine kinase-1 [Plasmodium gonderi]